jgi:hypothetical protein
MHFAVMHAAERNDEFITRSSAERAGLDMPKVVRVRRTSPADEARLLGDKA